jgi:hypothetical protein
MSIVTISRGTYTRGKEIAEKLAAKLGYECLSREILLEASEQFNIPEIKLVRAIHNAPSILERFTIRTLHLWQAAVCLICQDHTAQTCAKR